MAGNCRLGGGVNPSGLAQQPEGQKGNDEAHGGAGQQQGKSRKHAAIGSGQRRPALEADRHHQIDRQIAADAFRNVEIGLEQARGDAQGEEQNRRRQQILKEDLRKFHRHPRRGF